LNFPGNTQNVSDFLYQPSLTSAQKMTFVPDDYSINQDLKDLSNNVIPNHLKPNETSNMSNKIKISKIDKSVNRKLSGRVSDQVGDSGTLAAGSQVVPDVMVSAPNTDRSQTQLSHYNTPPLPGENISKIWYDPTYVEDLIQKHKINIPGIMLNF